ncbi:hypothetical protein B0H11DRAFT_227987 [Mycena galericulata]|nr:hypothetical protein B0H11DRAFT_227987 [Mycena galericulata]
MDLTNAERQLLKDSSRELAILDFLEQQIDDPALRNFAGKYAGLVEVVIAARLSDSVKRFRAQAAYLTALAGIASFLASVQIGFIPVINSITCDATPPPPDGCDPHSRRLRNVTIFLSYIALSLDALGALFSLLTARTLLAVSSHGQDLLDEKFSLDELILGQKDVQTRRALEFNILSKTADSLFERVDRQRHIMRHHTGGQYGVISFILFGMIFFFAALILEVIIGQPRGLWIAFVICVFILAAILAWNERRANPRLWSKLVEWIRPKRREEDVEQEQESKRIPELGKIDPQTLEDLFQQRLFNEKTISVLWEQLSDAKADAYIRKTVLQFFTAGIVQSIFSGYCHSHPLTVCRETLGDLQ